MRSLVTILGYVLFMLGAGFAARVIVLGQWDDNPVFGMSMIGLAILGMALPWLAKLLPGNGRGGSRRHRMRSFESSRQHHRRRAGRKGRRGGLRKSRKSKPRRRR